MLTVKKVIRRSSRQSAKKFGKTRSGGRRTGASERYTISDRMTIKRSRILRKPNRSQLEAMTCFLISLKSNGGGYPNLLEPTVVVQEHAAQWVKSRIELKKLRRLRQAGLTESQLAERYGVSKSTVKRRLRELV